MTGRWMRLAACAAGVLGAVAAAPGARSADARQCFPIAGLKTAFQVVFPHATQMTLEGEAATAYLRAYNNFGRPTDFTGDALFLNILPNGTAMLIPLKDGVGCNRMIVGPKLHRVIMTRVARAARDRI